MFFKSKLLTDWSVLYLCNWISSKLKPLLTKFSHLSVHLQYPLLVTVAVRKGRTLSLAVGRPLSDS